MSDKTVLVVDDDEHIVQIVTTLLDAEGYKAIGSLDGSEAFELARSHRPDLIIADIMMPVMDGWELCWRVRQDEALANTPFIFLTARADVMDQIRGSEIGADDYIVKPFRKQEFLKRIASTFEVIDLLGPTPATKAQKTSTQKAKAKKAKKTKAQKTKTPKTQAAKKKKKASSAKKKTSRSRT